jgi:hypothetical protein
MLLDQVRWSLFIYLSSSDFIVEGGFDKSKQI